MTFALILQPVSILLEAAALVFSILLAIKKKKSYGWCFAITFAIYIFYDISNYLIANNIGLPAYMAMPKSVLYAVFFVASVSILWAVTRVYKES
ncbi:MAG: hypothetical protein ABIJ26_08695 [Candidatus Margulisiibacteriota bacterium]